MRVGVALLAIAVSAVMVEAATPIAKKKASSIRKKRKKTAKRLKASLVGREHTVIADVPYRRSGPSEPDETEEEGVRPGAGGVGPRPVRDE